MMKYKKVIFVILALGTVSAFAAEPRTCQLSAKYSIEKTGILGKKITLKSDVTKFCSTDQVPLLSPGVTFVDAMRNGLYIFCGNSGLSQSPLLKVSFEAIDNREIQVSLATGRDEDGAVTQIKVRNYDEKILEESNLQKVTINPTEGFIVESPVSLEFVVPNQKRTTLKFEKVILECK